LPWEAVCGKYKTGSTAVCGVVLPSLRMCWLQTGGHQQECCGGKIKFIVLWRGNHLGVVRLPALGGTV